MPKFSAYMRGEKGPQGEVGQSVLLNGIVSSSSELPPNTENQKNLIYYVGNNEDGYNLYVYTTTEQSWQDLGSVNGIEGQSGGFSTNQNAQIQMLNPDANPTISITTDENSPDTAKVFNFNFGIPRSYSAGFSTNQNIEVENVNEVEDMYASISTDEQSPDTSKVFNFKFGIPRGESAGFGEIESTAELIPSASTYTQSGNIVSFSTNYENPIKEGIVNIEPVQDLHGYDNPWPGGGGKNLLPLTVENLKALNTNGVWSNKDYTYLGITFVINTDTNNNVSNIIVKGGTSTGQIWFYLTPDNYNIPEGSYYLSGCPSGGSTNTFMITTRIDNNGTIAYQADIGNGKNFVFTSTYTHTRTYIEIKNNTTINTNGITFKPMLEVGNTATSFAPYSNICPISGFTGMNITRTGKNLCEEIIQGGWDSRGIQTVSQTRVITKNYIKVNSGETIYLDYESTDETKTANINISFYKIGDYKTSRISETNWNSNKTIIIPQGCNYIRALYRYADNSDVTPSSFKNISIAREPLYEPYQGTTYPISWSTQAGTVYGGSLDVTTGVLTVDWRSITFTGAEEEGWKIGNTGTENWYYVTKNDILINSIDGINLISNLYPWGNVKIANTDKGIWNSGSSNYIRVRWGTQDTIENWKSFLASNPLHVIYKTLEPITYQLTPTQITALLGQNNIWADTGDIQVSYDKFNQPHVEVIADESSPNSAKNFTFHFDIPQGPKGDKGDAFSIYEPLSFTTGSNYWVNTTTFVYPRGANDKLPIYIYNEDTDKLDNDFAFTENTIIYNSEQPFNGTLYLMTSANRPSITIGEVSTTSFDGQMSISLNENSTSSDAIFDFTLASGPDGEPGGFGEITSSAELIPSTSNYIEKDNIVSFTTDDEIKEVVVDIDPVQDLHGYDNPWIGGSGKNLLDLSSFSTTTKNGITFTITKDSFGTVTKIIANGTATANAWLVLQNFYLPDGNYILSGCPSGGSNSTYELTVYIPKQDEGYTYFADYGSGKSFSLPYNNTNTINFQIGIRNGCTVNNLEFYPMIRLASVTDATFAPYSNICPITGWTGMNMTRSGKNLLETVPMTKQHATQPLTVTVNIDGSITIDGSTNAKTVPIINLAYPEGKSGKECDNKKHIPNGTYKKTCSLDDARFGLQIYGSNTENAGGDDVVQISNVNIREFTIDDTYKYNYARLYVYVNSTFNNETFYPYIYRVDETDMTWEPYTGTTYPISWSTQAGVVYGGNLNVTTGILTISKVKVNFENLTFVSQWTTDGNINTAYANLPYQGKNNSNNYKTGINAITNFSKWYPYDTTYNELPSIWNIRNDNNYPTAFSVVNTASNPTTRIVIKDNQCSTITEYREKYINNNYYVVYDLAEPIIHHLTPTQITTLLNENIIWADTGETQVTYSKLNQPYVEVTTDEESPNSAKNFNFHFSIPRGKEGDKGERGDSIAIYEGISFSTGSSYWNNNTLTIPRGDNNKLPIYVYNEDANKLDDNFTFTSTNIIYSTTSAFNGTLYLMSETLRNTLAIGNVSTTTYGNGSSFKLNPESTSTDAIFDVVLEQGPRGETALSAQVGRVSSTTAAPNVEIEGEQDLIFNFDLPKGDKGDKGDPFTVEVNNTIDILNYYETPAVETTSTSTGISLKFKLPPSVSARLGDLSQYNTLSLASNLITDILPISKGGTSATTATAAWTALGGGASGKHPDSYFALAEHGTHVSYGTTTTAIGTTASAGTASTVSRSDHVHNISVTTGDNNGQVKIAGVNINVKGLGSYAYKSSLSLTTGDNNGQIKIEGTNIDVKGLGSAAYTNSTAYAAASHTHSYLPLSGGTLTGALNLANNIWNNIGDNCALGDCNVSGCIGIKGLNGTTGLNFIQYGETAAGTIKWSGSNFTFSHAIIIPSSMYGNSNPNSLSNGQLYFVYE